MDLERVVWEGWRVKDFIEDLDFMVGQIMNGDAIIEKFTTKEELKEYLRSEQPHHKKDIPEVIEHFATMYKLE